MLALTLTIVVMAQGGGAAAPVELSVRPAAKVRIPYTLEVKASTTLRHGAETFESTTNGEQSFELEALETSAEGATRFAIHFGRAKGTAKQDGSSDPFDSEKPRSKRIHPILDGDPIATGMLRRAGKTVHATVTSRGEVEKVEGLVELYAGVKDLEGIPVEQEIQELFPRLPYEVITPRTKWTGDFTFSPSKDATVEFTPDCAASQVTADAIAWSIKTPAIGSPGSKTTPKSRDSKERLPGPTQGKAWKSASWTIEAAAVSGSTQVAPADGLVLRQSIDWAFDLLYGELETDSKTLSISSKRRVETVRR